MPPTGRSLGRGPDHRQDMTRSCTGRRKDGAVGPWLIPVMAQTAAYGSDGFNQKFGLNALAARTGPSRAGATTAS